MLRNGINFNLTIQQFNEAQYVFKSSVVIKDYNVNDGDVVWHRSKSP